MLPRPQISADMKKLSFYPDFDATKGYGCSHKNLQKSKSIWELPELSALKGANGAGKHGLRSITAKGGSLFSMNFYRKDYILDK